MEWFDFDQQTCQLLQTYYLEIPVMLENKPRLIFSSGDPLMLAKFSHRISSKTKIQITK